MKKTPLEVDSAVLDLNLVGTISLTKAVLAHMIERHQGQIVVVSSVLGKYGNVINSFFGKYIYYYYYYYYYYYHCCCCCYYYYYYKHYYSRT